MRQNAESVMTYIYVQILHYTAHREKCCVICTNFNLLLILDTSHTLMSEILIASTEIPSRFLAFLRYTVRVLAEIPATLRIL